MAGLVLTGGSSRRMGTDKADLVVAGSRLVDRVVGALTAVAAPVLEVGPGRSVLPAVLEDPPGAGPLAALGAGWRALSERGHRGPVLLMACDLALVDEKVARLLAGWPAAGSVVPVIAGRDQPLCARWSAADLDTVPRLLTAGERSLRALLARPGLVRIGEAEWGAGVPARAFADVDEPGDLARLGLPLGDRGQSP